MDDDNDIIEPEELVQSEDEPTNQQCAQTLGGAKDPQRYFYTRCFAGFCLGALFAITIYILIVVTIWPDKSVALERVSGILLMLIATFGGIIGAYVGVSNGWGLKK